MPTPPPPDPGAEVDVFNITNLDIDGSGKVAVAVDSFANKDNPNDVTITNSSSTPITELTVEKFGDNDGEKDVIRLDLGLFDDNFTLILKNTGNTIDDFLYLEGVHRYVDNGDGTFSVSYYGSDAQLHFITVQPEDATVEFYYAPDGIVDGEEGADTIGPGDADFQDDSIDGADGDDDEIVGYGGADSIAGGAGADTIFGDYDTFDGLLTPDLPTGAFTGTPSGPAPGAEIDSFTLNDAGIDSAGKAVVQIDSFADKNNPNDVTINDGGTEELNLLSIEKGGDGDGEADVFRIDLSGYNDDFNIELKNTDSFDKLVLTNVHTIDENPDGTFTVTYYGADALLHTISEIKLHNATIEAYVTPESPYFYEDTIDGGAGDDVIDGGFGDDSIDGGADNDSIKGGVGLDTLSGGGGADTIYGDFDAPLVPEDPPGTPDLTIDGTDFPVSSGVFEPTVDTLMAPALANHIEFVDNGTLSGLTEIKPRNFDDANEPDILEFDLSTFDDDFNINIRSRGDPNDEIYLKGVYSSEELPSGDWVVTYYGTDEQLHTVTIEPGNATVQTFFGPAPDAMFADEHDLIFGDAGDDSLFGGFGDDTIDGGTENDYIDGGQFDDSLIGGAGADTIYGGDGATSIPLTRVAFQWSDVPDPDNGGQIDNGDVLTTGVQNVNGTDVSFTINQNVTYSPGGEDGAGDIYVAGIDAGTGSVNPFSAASIDDAMTMTVSFEVPVENIQFRLNDFEIAAGTATITVYDDLGNPTTFTVTEGTNIVGSDSDTIAGNDTFYSSGSGGDNSVDGSILVTIPGPASSFEIDFISPGGDSLTMSDIWFDEPSGGSSGAGNDSISAGDGDDVIIAGLGTDTIDGGTGIDRYDANTSPDLVAETITVTVDQNGDGTSVKSVEGTTDQLTSVEEFIAGEDAAEADSLTMNGGVLVADVSGMNNAAVGTFTSQFTGLTYNFGGGGAEPTINDILAGTYDPGTGPLSPVGTFNIISGEEDGAQVGTFYMENFENINFRTVACFVRGSRIATNKGDVPIQDLKVGDLVHTLDHGLQDIRWIGSTTVPATDRLAPILIRKGALENSRDLWVSPQHRMLLSGWRMELLFGMEEALVPAKMLVNDQTILRAPGGIVEYFHLLFDRHEVIYSEGIPSESFHPGDVGVGCMAEAAREEIFTLFPELRADISAFPPTVRPTLKAFEAEVLTSDEALFVRARKLSRSRQAQTYR